MLTRLYENHVLANLIFILVLAAGITAYFSMPREQSPSINFNWVQISTVYPGASAEDVEQLVTAPLEEGIRKVKDIRFSSSTSGEGMSTILIRFEDTNAHTYDKRLIDFVEVQLLTRQPICPPHGPKEQATQQRAEYRRVGPG